MSENVADHVMRALYMRPHENQTNQPINSNNITEDVANSEIKSIADVITPTSNTPSDNNVIPEE
jgi:hypothetical protein